MPGEPVISVPEPNTTGSTDMKIFHRKSAWERALEGVVAVAAARSARRAAKITAGAVGGAATLTALSAAVSSARRRDKK
jgi:hypothetical protein